MNTISTASSFLNKGETAVVLNTSGELLSFKDGVPVQSGNWRINRRKMDDLRVNKVIIYHRDVDRVRQRNDVYLAEYDGIEPADAESHYGAGRFVVRLKAARHVGTSRLNWYEFAETGSCPVRYLTGGK